MNTVRIKTDTATTLDGPSYEVQTEDGPASRWDFYVQVVTEAGIVLTYWTPLRSRATAERLAERVNAAGYVTRGPLWTIHDPWEPYHENLSMVERLGHGGAEWTREMMARANREA